MINSFVKDKVKLTIEKLKELEERTIYDIKEMKYIPCEYRSGNKVPEVDSNWRTFSCEDRVRGRDAHFWFYTEFETPDVAKNEQLFFELTTGHEGEWDADNPQGILYLNGKIAQGLDVNHRHVKLLPNTKYKVHLYFYVGMKESYTEVRAKIKVRDTYIHDLYYDMRVPYDAAMCFSEEEFAHIRTMKHLDIACNLIDFKDLYSDSFYNSICKAKNYLKEEYFEKECGKSDAIVSYVGHTHIDIAWLWTLAQTREKVQRTFSTVLTLMERYPEYIFMSSQPQLYEYLKEEEPELYEKIKERVREGRWEVEGAMWLEADCNLSSGESLVRQILYGKRFMKDEFDVDSKILWLPDVFGYSAALPQILKKSGIDKFVTSKISWNETNKMPYDTFMWEGIDGTEIFSYFLTSQDHETYLNNDFRTRYNAFVTPSTILGTWERYQQKDYNNEAILTFGYGDGGGGPTEDMIETEKRLEFGLPGLPQAKMTRAGDFLERAKHSFDENCKITGRTPKWVGELYLELHRGTYTSIAKNKKNNRECEFLCQDAEALSVLNEMLFTNTYPQKIFHDSWKTILLNQFHDIIPGSSVCEVYEDSDKQYAKVRKDVGAIKEDAIKVIADNVSQKGILVYNPNSFNASGYVEYNGDLIFAENIPAVGWKVVEVFKKSEDVKIDAYKIESKHYIILFDENYNITSVYDKDFEREVIKAGEKANVLRAYEDYPRVFDNWEISSYYKDKPTDIENVKSVRQISGKGYAGFEIEREFYNSIIKQKIIVYNNSRRIDFKNDIDWHEHHIVLKTIFPVDIHANKASYDIQFGNAERANHENTSWDRTKFEVCAHKWADLSEDGYGVSLLNDCKYGYGILGNEMSLTLLKCGTYPNPEADQGKHSFTYSLYPHRDNFKIGGTINESYLLNRPMSAVFAQGEGNLSSEFSLVSCNCENIVIETVKKAEKGDAIIIRLFDAWNKKSKTVLKLGFDAKKISLCDMMENPTEEIGSGNSVDLNIGNFEIVTLLVEM